MRSDGDLFLVTAYHVVQDYKELYFSPGPFDINELGLEDRFYYNRASDIAIFQLNEVGKKKVSEHPVRCARC